MSTGPLQLPQGCTSTLTDRRGSFYGFKSYRRFYIDQKGNEQETVRETLVRKACIRFRSRVAFYVVTVPVAIYFLYQFATRP